jgi:hypothetical protein
MTIEDRKDACYVYMERKDNGYGYGFEYRLDMAKRAGSVKDKGAWTTYPEWMLRWRAIGVVSIIVFADALSGLAISTESVDYIDVEPVEK